MPMLLLGEDAVPDCFALAEADVGLLPGGDSVRRGTAKQNVAIIRRSFIIKCLFLYPLLDLLTQTQCYFLLRSSFL
jgi:hypothetical protein